MAISQNSDQTVYGNALLDFGLSVSGAVSGLGLETNGLMWSCPDVWVPCDNLSLATIWTSSENNINTTWTSSEIPGLSTIWTDTAEGEC